jgi:NAD(P)-dependent dehydrogenase (short-subunit alcohol dehydrogenase family)
MKLLLQDKNAAIYGGGGSIGGAVAREFAREGAHVFLAGRTREKLEMVASDIKADGGSAEVAVLDAFDEKAVDEHAQAAVSQAGGIDVSLNLIMRGDVQGIPLVDMTPEDLLCAVINGLRSNFLTARAASRRMMEQGSGAATCSTNPANSSMNWRVPKTCGNGAPPSSPLRISSVRATWLTRLRSPRSCLRRP